MSRTSLDTVPRPWRERETTGKTMGTDLMVFPVVFPQKKHLIARCLDLQIDAAVLALVQHIVGFVFFRLYVELNRP